MTIFSYILNYLFASKFGPTQEMQEKVESFRTKATELRNSPEADYDALQEFQAEMMAFMKVVFKKQLVPLCVRSLVFLGIFAIIGIFYGDYRSGLLSFPILFFGTGWIAVYFLWSILLGFAFWGIRRLYKKITGKTIGSNNMTQITREISQVSRILMGRQQAMSFMGQSSNRVVERPMEPAWKRKLRESKDIGTGDLGNEEEN